MATVSGIAGFGVASYTLGLLVGSTSGSGIMKMFPEESRPNVLHMGIGLGGLAVAGGTILGVTHRGNFLAKVGSTAASIGVLGSVAAGALTGAVLVGTVRTS